MGSAPIGSGPQGDIWDIFLTGPMSWFMVGHMSQPEPLPRTWLPTTVAAQLKVSERTVNRWANEGILPSLPGPGATGAWFFRAEDVRRLADDRIACFMPDLTAGSAS